MVHGNTEVRGDFDCLLVLVMTAISKCEWTSNVTDVSDNYGRAAYTKRPVYSFQEGTFELCNRGDEQTCLVSFLWQFTRS